MVMMYTKSKLLHILGALVAVAVLSAAEVNSEELTTGDRAAISDWFSQYAHVIDRRKFDTDFESLRTDMIQMVLFGQQIFEDDNGKVMDRKKINRELNDDFRT